MIIALNNITTLMQPHLFIYIFHWIWLLVFINSQTSYSSLTNPQRFANHQLWITSICDDWNMCSFCGVLGGTVAPDTTLVFDLVLLDIFNRADQVQTKVISTPTDCKRSVMRTDFVRFHFNASLLDGTVFDSRFVLLHVPVTSINNDCFQTSFLNTPVLNSHSSLSNALLVQPPANRECSQNSRKVLVTKLVWSLIRFSKM